MNALENFILLFKYAGVILIYPRRVFGVKFFLECFFVLWYFITMSTTEKIILIAALIFSWLFGFLAAYIIKNSLNLGSIVWLLIVGMTIWLFPFILLLLFSRKKIFTIAVFILGILGLLLAVINIYVILSLFLLVLAFVSWQYKVSYAQKSSINFSVTHALKGISFFFTMLAAVGGLMSFYSPYAAQVILEPRIPEKWLDSIYNPLSSIMLGQLNGQLQNQSLNQGLLNNPLSKLPGAQKINDELPNGRVPESVSKDIKDAQSLLPNPTQIKAEVYKRINGSVANLADKYQGYIPFAFAASTFLLLRTVFIPVKYLLMGIAFILIKLFIKIGWFRKESKQVEVEEIII